MKITVKIKRQNSPDSAPFYQTILRECDQETSVATLIREINAESISDIEGKPVEEISWECSCLQKKCGACAMRINGIPRLACDTKIAELKSLPMTRRAVFNVAAALRYARILRQVRAFSARRRLFLLQESFRSSRKGKNTI